MPEYTPKEPEKKEYAPLTPAQQKYVERKNLWRYGYPGLVLVALFLLPYDTPLIAWIGMLPYTIVTFLLARKPSLVIVFTLQQSRKEPPHLPETPEEEERYRKDGRALAIVLAVLTVAFFVLWLVRRSRAV